MLRVITSTDHFLARKDIDNRVIFVVSRHLQGRGCISELARKHALFEFK